MVIPFVASTKRASMFMSIALGTSRYVCALALGLLFNALLFTVLWSLSSTLVESKAVVATRIVFTRVHQNTETVSHHESNKPKMDVIEMPRAPQLELAVATAPPSALQTLTPVIDMRTAFKDAASAMGYGSEVIPVVRIPPSYPRPARLARIQGYVTMEVVISPDGTVTDVSIVEAAPPRMFDIAAMDAMKRWKFRPRLVNGVAVSQRAHQTIEFKIEEG
jgi:protein TonB